MSRRDMSRRDMSQCSALSRKTVLRGCCVAGERQYEAKVYAAMQHESMSTKVSIGDKIVCPQVDASKFACYAGPIIESWVHKQRRYTWVVWKCTGTGEGEGEEGEGELLHVGLSGTQAVTPR